MSDYASDMNPYGIVFCATTEGARVSLYVANDEGQILDLGSVDYRSAHAPAFRCGVSASRASETCYTVNYERQGCEAGVQVPLLPAEHSGMGMRRVWRYPRPRRERGQERTGRRAFGHRLWRWSETASLLERGGIR